MTGTAHPGECRTGRDIPTRRVVVHFEGRHPSDDMVLEYAATDAEACEFATAALRNGLAVTVDRRLRPGMRPLPCRRLWDRRGVTTLHSEVVQQ